MRKRTVTRAEGIRRRNYVRSLMLSGLSRDQIVEAAVEQGIPRHAARALRDEVLAQWRADSAEEADAARAEAIQRVRRDLAAIRNPGILRNKNGYPVYEKVLDERGTPVREGRAFLRRPVPAPIDWARVVAHERFLSELEGTAQPDKIEVSGDLRVSAALNAVLQAMTPERMEQIVRADRERERLARLAVEKLPEAAEELDPPEVPEAP